MIIIILVIITGFVFWRFFRSKKSQNHHQSFAEPATINILANSKAFRSTTRLLEVLLHFTRKHNGIVKFQIGPIRNFVVVSDYKLIELILSSTKFINKSADYKFFRPWLGTGLLTSDGRGYVEFNFENTEQILGPKWKKHRRILTPAFHFQILEQFIEVFEECAEKLTQKLEQEVGKSSFDIYPYVTLCTLDIICESIMGTNINAQDDENSLYVRSVKDMCRIVMERAISPLQMFDLLYPFSKNFYTQKRALRILHSQTNKVITKRRQELENEVKDDVHEEISLTKNKKVFLDLLLQATVDGRKLTQEEIREEVDTFMFEGHDTTASAIGFSLFCLANHSSVQKKVLEEQQELFGNNKNPTVTYADLQSMKYLELVIKETLRLYPSVPIYGRQVEENIVCGETTFCQGDTIAIFAYGIQRNPDHFENPDEFNPGRFENLDGKSPYAYIPFSAGSRNCIGQKFAMLEMKSTIARVLRKFELQPATPQHVLKLAAESVLKSANGIKISLKFRD